MPATGTQHCPKCGKPTWGVKRVYPEHFKPHWSTPRLRVCKNPRCRHRSYTVEVQRELHRTLEQSRAAFVDLMSSVYEEARRHQRIAKRAEKPPSAPPPKKRGRS